MSESPDPDLRDVFRLLYAEDDWAFSDTEDSAEEIDDTHPPLDAIAPEMEVELVEADLSSPSTSSNLEKYSRKRFFDALDSLLTPSSPSSSSSKRKRIYGFPSPSTSTPSIIPSTQPIPTLPSPSSYAPYSPLALLARLRTFSPYTYSAHPDALSPVTAALHGWTNEGREGLKCGVCGEKWGLGGLGEIQDEKVRVEVANRLARGFEGRHKSGCAWPIRGSPDTLHSHVRNLLHPALTSSLSALAEAIQRDARAPQPSEISWTSPLNEPSSEALTTALNQHDSSRTAITEIATSLALFCWYPYHPNNPSSSSVTPSLSDSASASTDILSCRICRRRVGLWSFRKSASEKASFDVLNEHLEWCPIRPKAGEKSWWEDIPLLQGRTKGDGRVRDLVKVSEKLEIKPWRRTR